MSLKKELLMYSIDNKSYMPLDQLLNELIISKQNVSYVFRGVFIFFTTHDQFFDADYIIDGMIDVAQAVGKFRASDYCAELEKYKHKENLKKIVLDYLNNNVSQPNFHGQNIKNIRIDLEQKDLIVTNENKEQLKEFILKGMENV